MRRNLAAVAEVAGRAKFGVARDEGRVVGSDAYGPVGRNHPAVFPPDWAAVLLLAVDPATRGQGIGRRLTEVCVARAREDGATVIGLFTSEAMPVAQRLYEALLFTRRAKRPRRHGPRYWLYNRDLSGGKAAT
jgi:ribosomal protein S18 acetylase RimI-like enzyme